MIKTKYLIEVKVDFIIQVQRKVLTAFVLHLYFLGRTGMTLQEITKQIADQGMTKEEKIRILRITRGQLLEEIHCKQQLLDQVDYMLHELRVQK